MGKLKPTRRVKPELVCPGCRSSHLSKLDVSGIDKSFQPYECNACGASLMYDATDSQIILLGGVS